jgi:hypothetical protein
MSHRRLLPARASSRLVVSMFPLALAPALAACGSSGEEKAAVADAAHQRRDAVVDTDRGVDAPDSLPSTPPPPDAAVGPPSDAGGTPLDAEGDALADARPTPPLDAAAPETDAAAPADDATAPPDPDAVVPAADAAPLPPDGPLPGSLDTFIDLPPPALTNTPVLGLRLRASSPRATFECRLDDAAFASCEARPATRVEGDGPHVFQARAVFGAEVDETPAEVAFTLDTVAPELAVAAEPPDPHPRAARFTLAWDAQDATVTCRLDGRPLADCPPMLALVGLAEGPHALEVVATDTAGNETSRTVEWSVSVETTTMNGPDERRFLAFDGPPSRAARVAVGPDGIAHHLYGTAHLWYRTSAPDASVEVVEDVPVSLASAIAIGPAGIPHAVYFDRRNARLKHAWRAAEGWQVEDTGLIDDLGPATSIDDGLALAVGPDEGLHLLWAQQSAGNVIHHATRPAVGADAAPGVRGPEAWTNRAFLPASRNDAEIGLVALPDGRLWAAYCHGDGQSPWATAVYSAAEGWAAVPMPAGAPGCRDRAPPAKLSLRVDGGIDAVLGTSAFYRAPDVPAWSMLALPGLSLPAGALARDEPGAWRVDAFFTGRGLSIVAGDVMTFTLGPDGVQSERRLRLGPDNSPSLAAFDRWPGQATHGHVAWPTRLEGLDPTTEPVTRTLLDEGHAYGALDTSVFQGDRLMMAETRVGAVGPDAASAPTLYLMRHGTDRAGADTSLPVALTLREGRFTETPLPLATGLTTVDARGRVYRLIGRERRQLMRFDPETGLDVAYPAVPEELGSSPEAMHALPDGTVYIGYSGPDRIVRLNEALPTEILPLPGTFDAALDRNQCPLRLAGGEADRPLIAVYGCDWRPTDVVVWHAGLPTHTELASVHGPVAPFASETRIGFVELDVDGPAVLRVFESGPRGWSDTETPVDPQPSGFAFDARMGADDRLRVLLDGVVVSADPNDDPAGERSDAVHITHWIETTERWRSERVGTGGGDLGLFLDAAGDATMLWWDRRELAWRMARR